MNLKDMSEFRDVLTELKMIFKTKFPDVQIWISEDTNELKIILYLKKRYAH